MKGKLIAFIIFWIVSWALFAQKETFKLYTLDGKLVKKGNDNKIDTTFLPNGFYLLSVGDVVYKVIK
jgi:hypothetical protein